jgi:hypothetical protein
MINIGQGVDKVDFAHAQLQVAEHFEHRKPESKTSEHTERQKVRKKQKELKKKLEKIMLQPILLPRQERVDIKIVP